jgi:hypothetical protein
MADPDGMDPVNVFFVYDGLGMGFKSQANWMIKKYYKGKDVEVIYVVRASQFMDAWNKLADDKREIGDVHLFLHGDVGKLFFKQYDYYNHEIDKDLKKLNVKGTIYLYSCDGGTAVDNDFSKSVAAIFAKKAPSAHVRAVVNGSVYYRSITQIFARKPLTKEAGAYWADFFYKKPVRTSLEVFKIGNKWSL